MRLLMSVALAIVAIVLMAACEDNGARQEDNGWWSAPEGWARVTCETALEDPLRARDARLDFVEGRPPRSLLSRWDGDRWLFARPHPSLGDRALVNCRPQA